MDPAAGTLACAWALVDELVAGGVRHACLSPGSRSTPLALALARHPAIELHVHLDERSSAFVAIGIARSTRRPVVVATTSGTAVAELAPAVVEAWQARVPLVLLTADRPPRLRGTGANQTIDQVGIFGGHAAYLEPPVAGPTRKAAWSEAGRTAALVVRRTSTPVHLNCPIEEPLVPSGEVALEPSARPLDPPVEEAPSLGAADEERLGAEVEGARGVVVVGGTWPVEPVGDLSCLARLGWPVLAEPISGLRRPGDALAAGQALIGDPGWTEAHPPEVVLQLGATPTTRATQAFVAGAARLLVADRTHPNPDPERRATWRLRADLPAVLAALERLVEERSPAPEGWRATWAEADARARRALDRAMDGWDEPFEPRVARDVAAWVPQGGTLFVGNSLPIRDLDLTMAPRTGLRVVANRGASGIDGLVSTAIGLAAAGRPVVGLLGDLSFVHDAGALLWNGPRRGPDLVLVVLANGGGEIFSLLAHEALPEHEALFRTSHGLDLGAVCAAAGVGHERVEAAGELLPALDRAADAGGLRVVEVAIDAALGRERRAALRRSVAEALEGA